jgi:riboflavin kinase/FMN adenylyltransferase
MRVFRGLRHPGIAKACALTIGNFDGVHRGHQALVQQLVHDAGPLGLAPTAMTFAPHPAHVLGKPVHPALTPLAHKRALLAAAAPGLQVVVEPFSLELAKMEPADFVQKVLVENYRAERVIVGENFRFGKDRKGDLAALSTLGQRFGFTASAMPLQMQDGVVISSSRIRALLAAGEVEAAARLLGRNYALWGNVAQGKQLGRQLGFPTANLSQVEQLLPKPGVYACRVSVDSLGLSVLPGVCNLGTRPTVDGTNLSIEAHLFDFEGDLYGRSVSVAFVARLRDEQRFADLPELKAQIGRDCVRARSLLGAAEVT